MFPITDGFWRNCRKFVDMFPQTDSFQNSSRHQSEPLEPCGDDIINVKGGETGF